MHHGLAGVPVQLIDVRQEGSATGAVDPQRCHREALRLASQRDPRVVTARCEHGLWSAAVPLIIDGEHLGTLLLGLFRYDDDPPPPVTDSSPHAGLEQVPCLPRARVRGILELLSALTAVIASAASREQGEPASDEEDGSFHARDHLEKLINAIADPLFVKDRRHRWAFLNDAYCQFMGYSREALLGKTDHDFFPGQEADLFWEKDELVFQTGRDNLSEENFTDAQGVTTPSSPASPSTGTGTASSTSSAPSATSASAS